MYKDPSVFTRMVSEEDKETKYIVTSDAMLDNSAPITSTLKVWSISKISEYFIDNQEFLDGLNSRATNDSLKVAENKIKDISNQIGDSRKGIIKNINDLNNTKQSIEDNRLNTDAKTVVGAINEVKALVGSGSGGGGGNVDLSNYYTRLQTDNLLNNKVDSSTFNLLKTKVDSVEKNKQNKTDSSLTTSSKTITGAINEVKTLVSNIPEVDLSNYYTKGETFSKTEVYPKTETYSKTEVNQKIDDAVTGGSVDLSNYYTKPQTDNLLTSKADSSKVYPKTETYSKTEVDKKIDDAVTGGTIDLSNYYTKPQTDNLLGNKANISTVTTLDTKVTGLENNKQNKTDNNLTTTSKEIVGAINEVKTLAGATPEVDLSNYYTKSQTYGKTETYNKGEVDKKIDDVVTGGSVDLSNYYTKSQTDGLLVSKANTSTVSSLDTKVTGLENNKQNKTDSNLTTTSKEIVGAINEVKTLASSIPEVDLSNYYTKAQTYSKTEIYNKTETYNKTEVDKKIGDAVTGGTVDLSNYYTKTETYSKTESNALLGKKADQSSLTSLNNEVGHLSQDKQNKVDNSLTTTSKEIAGAINEVKALASATPEVDLSNYYTKAQTYGKTEVYNKGEVDKKISDASLGGGGSVDLTNYYTKTETYNKTEADALLKKKADQTSFNSLNNEVGYLAQDKQDKEDERLTTTSKDIVTAINEVKALASSGSGGGGSSSSIVWKPSISAEGILSWTASTENTPPEPVDLKAMIESAVRYEVNQIISVSE